MSFESSKGTDFDRVLLDGRRVLPSEGRTLFHNPITFGCHSVLLRIEIRNSLREASVRVLDGWSPNRTLPVQRPVHRQGFVDN